MGALTRVTSEMSSLDLTNGQILVGFDVSTKEGRIRLYKANRQADEAIANMVGKTIAIETFAIGHRDKVDSETGELRRQLRTVIWDRDGFTYVTTSEVVIKHLADLVNIYGPPPWRDGPIVKVESKKGESARTYYGLELVGDSVGAPAQPQES